MKTKERLVEEITQLTKGIQDREATIVKLEADVKSFRGLAVTNESLAKAIQTRNELLLEQLREVEQKMARMQAGANNIAGIKISNGFNPPAVKVNGKIVKVDNIDNGLVEISLGTDDGVDKHNTLDVFRFNPEPKYLGTVRIVDAYHHKSVARLIAAGGPAALRPQLKQGDLVASSVIR